jgi:integrase
MGIKYDEKSKTYIVTAAKRHPITRQPKNLRRKGIRTEKEALKVEKELQSKLVRSFFQERSTSWLSACEAYLDDCRHRGLTEKSVYDNEVTLAKYTKDWNGLPIDRIHYDHIMGVINGRLAEKSAGQQENVVRVIRGVFNLAVQRGLITANPVPQTRSKRKDKVQKGLTASQVRLFLDTAKEMKVEWYYHWALAVYTGMRNGELYALRWSKVNLEEKQIIVDSSWHRQIGFKDTKSGDDRILAIAPNLLQVLRQLRIEDPKSEFVLPRLPKWEKGDQARELRTFLAGLRMPPLRFHDLRAVWATLLLSKGVEPIKVMKMGGWKNLKTMMKYVRNAGVDIEGATDCLDLHDPSTERGKVIQFPSL